MPVTTVPDRTMLLAVEAALRRWCTDRSPEGQAAGLEPSLIGDCRTGEAADRAGAIGAECSTAGLSNVRLEGAVADTDDGTDCGALTECEPYLPGAAERARRCTCHRCNPPLPPVSPLPPLDRLRPALAEVDRRSREGLGR
ncbi:hypothetical protein [Streptomyces sp. ODS05-4]|uniref:hypothetical protein n=1 Tax=Streptomyces sp. ODS05-4 TaxID=2944939 RepID=UPI00210E4ADF|nr:hypothetical protein [Streptomyces sp. ODS05-4]